MADEAQDKQHEATGKRLTDLRKQGNVMRSRDLSGGLIFMVGILLLITMSTQIKNKIVENFVLSFSNFHRVIVDPDFIFLVLKTNVIDFFYQLLPIFIILFVVALLSPFLFGGWNFTLEVFQFKIFKVNPLENLLKLFRPKQAFLEIGRSMVKSTFFLFILVFYFLVEKNNIIDLINAPVTSAIYTSYLMIKNFIIILSGALIFVVIFDMVYHYFRYQEQTKMSMQEIKDEQKESDGSPEVKRKIRSKQLAVMIQRIKKSVPKANVVITNPTHYAVALRYESAKDSAPKVVAKGKGIIAQQIKTVAIENAVFIYEAPELARAIYYTTKIGAAIHPDLYKAVAIVLSYVYQLKNYQMGKGGMPEFISNLEIPKEFIYKE